MRAQYLGTRSCSTTRCDRLEACPTRKSNGTAFSAQPKAPAPGSEAGAFGWALDEYYNSGVLTWSKVALSN